ncbi:reverse transcriptase domain-containing protein [Tanacetum coccineum]
MLANVKIYDGTGDPEDHVGRFMGIGNQGEWPMPVWCRMFQQTLDGKARAWFDKLPSGSIDNWGSLQEKFLIRFGMLKACDKDPTKISKITRKANDTLPHFKERWVSESNVIPNVPELMQISSFKSSHKCLELAKRFSDSIPKTVDEMLKRLDDYLRSEEAYRITELPRGEFQRRDASVQWVQRNDRSQRFSHGNNRRRTSRPKATQAVPSTIHGMIENFQPLWGSNGIIPDSGGVLNVEKRERSRLYQSGTNAEEDEEKTAFYTDQGTYCYTKMSFGLKKAGATYQRLVDGAFQAQIGRNLEAYVDDMVIKSKSKREMLADIVETFDNLRRINMKLNPKKCSFRVKEGKFLGYMVTSEGIRANPAKTKDIAEIQSPRTWGEMQSLAGKLSTLNRFLS